MKLHFSCLLALFLTSFAAHAQDTQVLERPEAGVYPTDNYKEENCEQVFNDIAAKYLDNNIEILHAHFLLSPFVKQSELDINTLSSFKICGVEDLDQGSWFVKRLANYCGPDGIKINLITQGDLYCDGEVVLGVYSITK